jgi:LPS-assembly lipoprotein
MSWCDVRVARRRMLVVATALALAGCGFQLRGQATYAFDSIHVNAPAFPTFATELRRGLAGAGSAKLAEKVDDAQVIIDVVSILDDKQVLSLSPGGRVQEYVLTKVVVFRVRDRDGREWVKQDEIVVRRAYSYDDTERLAREIQEQRLQNDMQADAVQQIVRRLQVARRPA